MAVARSDDGTLPIRVDDVDLAALLQETVQQLESFARSNDVQLRTSDLPETLPMRADADWLRQALMALIDNAIKYSPASGTVEVSAERRGERVAICVTDEGAGVAEDELPLIASPYFQGAGAPPRIGTGLGLAVARWVAEQHGGGIEAENGVQRGLRVALLLPLQT